MGRPARYNIDLVRGDSKTYALAFTDNDGTAIDITGWTIYYTVKERLTDDDEDAIIRKIVTAEAGSAVGEVNIVLENTDTQDLEIKVYWHDIQVKNLDDKINTIAFGQLNVIADVTRTY